MVKSYLSQQPLFSVIMRRQLGQPWERLGNINLCHALRQAESSHNHRLGLAATCLLLRTAQSVW